MNAALVSVVMPCFNAARHVAASIASVQAQSLPDWTLIAVDDGSTDGTASVIQQMADPRIQLIRQSNAGVSAARNRALVEIQTPYVAFLDSDDTWAPNFLESMVGALARQDDAVVAYCGWEDLHQPPRQPMVHEPPDYEALPDKFMLLLQRCPWVIHAALARSDAVRSVGGFDPRFSVAEDYLMWLRMATTGRLIRVPELLASYHHDSTRTQATGNVVRVVRQTRAALMAFLDEHPKIRRRLGKLQTREALYRQGLSCAYDALWSRDLASAQSLFRDCLVAGYLKPKDLKYALPAVLPGPLYRAIVGARDGHGAKASGSR
ncbi:MAG: glycosyltransferase family A protein [Pseudomonadota bacterium]|nr:glycosyltransferase family A protein [Pseudomonadota bacterium]